MTKNEFLTFAELHAMSGSDLEQYAERGETDRSDLSRAVIHCLSLSGEWLCNIEHGSEFGGAAPVNIRLSLKAHRKVTLCLASSSDDVPFWQMYLPFNDGTSVAWIYCSETFDPELIFDTLQRIATLASAGFTTAERLAAALRQTGASV
jgi:hypothetical protein